MHRLGALFTKRHRDCLSFELEHSVIDVFQWFKVSVSSARREDYEISKGTGGFRY